MKRPKWKELLAGKQPNSFTITNNCQVFPRQCESQPAWISAINTEVLVKRNKSHLLISVGESWTYGDNFQGVQSGQGRDDPFYRLDHCFSGIMAKALNSDLLLFAVPGNCNQHHMHDLDRLLEEYHTAYEKITVVMQLTSPGRDNSEHHDYYTNLKGYDLLYSKQKTIDPILSMKDWFELYDEMMLSEYDRILKSYTNVNGIIWKNFNNFLVDFTSDSFIIVECPWVEHTAKMHGINIKLPCMNEAGWWEAHYKTYGNFEQNTDEKMEQLNRLEESTKLLNYSSWNGFHPKEIYHLAWASHLLDKGKLL